MLGVSYNILIAYLCLEGFKTGYVVEDGVQVSWGHDRCLLVDLAKILGLIGVLATW